MNIKIQQKRSKEMCMQFYWVRDQVKQKQLDVFWKHGVSNLGDYFTKHNYPEHQKGTRPVYLHCPKIGRASARVCYSK